LSDLDKAVHVVTPFIDSSAVVLGGGSYLFRLESELPLQFL